MKFEQLITGRLRISQSQEFELNDIMNTTPFGEKFIVKTIEDVAFNPNIIEMDDNEKVDLAISFLKMQVSLLLHAGINIQATEFINRAFER